MTGVVDQEQQTILAIAQENPVIVATPVVQTIVVETTKGIRGEKGDKGDQGDTGPPGSGSSYQLSFTAANLTVIGLLPVTHGLGVLPNSFILYDSDGNEFKPDDVLSVTTTTAVLDLKSFIGFSGTCTLAVGG